MEYLSNDFDKDEWELVNFEDIQKADRIAYYTKHFKYQNGKEQTPKFVKGGFCSFVEPEYIGLVNIPAHARWSIQKTNVLYFYRKKKRENKNPKKYYKNKT